MMVYSSFPIAQNIIPFFVSDDAILLQGDCLQLLDDVKKESVDLIFADPPYFLSNDGITCHSGKMVSVNKGNWDKIGSFDEKHAFNRQWIRLCKQVLKPSGSLWISGTYHNIYSIGAALEQEGFAIINNVTWQKTNPPPNLACRCFTHSTETIIWACKKEYKSQHVFNYDLMKEENGGKQMKDVWVSSLTPPGEKKEGRHPTQKPLFLLERIIKASSSVGDLILDPFCGSSTTGVAALSLGRKYIGIDSEQEYLALSERRLSLF